MNKEHLRTLLARYRSGDCTEREKYLVEQWFLTLDQDCEQLSEQDGVQLEEKIWNQIQINTNGAFASPSRTLSFQWRWLAAAILICITGLAGYHYFQKVSPTSGKLANLDQKEDIIDRNNKTNATDVFQLSDGTEVHLAPGSTISYPRVFDEKQRVVNLAGKAFFKVMKRTSQPFFVHTGEVVTKVLGTSFWVAGQRNGRAVEVSVVTGRVSVFQENEPSNEVTKSGVILTANQKVKYSGESREFVTSLVANPVVIHSVEKGIPKDQSFLFEDAPLITVVKKLEQAYGIEIILENEGLNGCLITADINSQPLFTKLELLCSSLNARYEVRGTKILVTGKGCLSDHLNPTSEMK
jgi:transmembrane sensor